MESVRVNAKTEMLWVDDWQVDWQVVRCGAIVSMAMQIGDKIWLVCCKVDDWDGDRTLSVKPATVMHVDYCGDMIVELPSGDPLDIACSDPDWFLDKGKALVQAAKRVSEYRQAGEKATFRRES